jgi:hypothetical protein
MNDMLNNLPSVRNLIKLIIVLVLVLIVVGILVEIVKTLMPLFFVALLVVGGVYLYRKLQTNNA